MNESFPGLRGFMTGVLLGASAGILYAGTQALPPLPPNYGPCTSTPDGIAVSLAEVPAGEWATIRVMAKRKSGGPIIVDYCEVTFEMPREEPKP